MILRVALMKSACKEDRRTVSWATVLPTLTWTPLAKSNIQSNIPDGGTFRWHYSPERQTKDTRGAHTGQRARNLKRQCSHRMTSPRAVRVLNNGFHPYDGALLVTKPRRLSIRDVGYLIVKGRLRWMLKSRATRIPSPPVLRARRLNLAWINTYMRARLSTVRIPLDSIYLLMKRNTRLTVSP